MKQPAIYIMSNKRNGTLYVGVTSYLIKRVYEHKDDSTIGLTARYNLYQENLPVTGLFRCLRQLAMTDPHFYML